MVSMTDLRTPTKGDQVLTTEHSGIFIVLDVDEKRGTSKLETDWTANGYPECGIENAGISKVEFQ